MRLPLRAAAAAFAVALGGGAAAHAATVTAVLPDIDGPANAAGFPISLGLFGPFNYVLPSGAVITAAFLEGTYGTPGFSLSSAGFDATVETQTLSVCVPLDPGCWVDGAAFRPFSFALSPTIFGDLLDGQASLEIIQTNATHVRYGTPTLRIEYRAAAIPEPGAWAVMLLGFGLMGGALRAARRSRLAAV